MEMSTRIAASASSPLSSSLPPDDREDNGLKRKRNKPTRSCTECVKRKSKCRREKPICSTCVERDTYGLCAYLEDLPKTQREGTKSSPRSVARFDDPFHLNLPILPNVLLHAEQLNDRPLLPRINSSSPEPSSTAYHQPASVNFGSGLGHPFENYWTMKGGLSELIAQDCTNLSLITIFFDAVDPFYPIINRSKFTAEYEVFWSSIPHLRPSWDGAWIARLFSILAVATQFYLASKNRDQMQKANFYVSAAYQALTLASFLNKASIVSLQSMIFIVYALMNDYHVSDGWAFSGVLVRQAQAMGLHRDPDIVVPTASPTCKSVRTRIWQAVRVQDTFLSLILGRPPFSTLADCNIDYVINPSDAAHEHYQREVGDVVYIKAMWCFTTIVQRDLCQPLALDLSIAPTPQDRKNLIEKFHNFYQNLPDEYTNWTEATMTEMGKTNLHGVLQILFLVNNYWNCLMIIHQSDEAWKEDAENRFSPPTVEAAEKALDAYFVVHKLFGVRASVWWVLQHRSFTEALILAKSLGPFSMRATDARLLRAETYVLKMISVFELEASLSPVARTRLKELQMYYEKVRQPPYSAKYLPLHSVA